MYVLGMCKSGVGNEDDSGGLVLYCMHDIHLYTYVFLGYNFQGYHMIKSTTCKLSHRLNHFFSSFQLPPAIFSFFSLLLSFVFPFL